jgi:hypothetical protein
MRYNSLSKRRHKNTYSFPPVFRIIFHHNFIYLCIFTFLLTDYRLHKYIAVMIDAVQDSPDTILDELDSPPVFTRLGLTFHTAHFRLKEHLMVHTQVSRLFLGVLLEHNLPSLEKRSERQPPFNLTLKLRECFPNANGAVYKAVIRIHPSDSVLTDTTHGILRIFNDLKGHRIALCEMNRDSDKLKLTPAPDETNTLRLYALGNDCNLHSPVTSTLIFQMR